MTKQILDIVLFLLSAVLLISRHVDCQEWPSPSFVEKTAPVSKKCVDSAGLDQNILNESRQGKLPDDENFKKFLLCVYEEFDLIDKEIHEFEYWKIMTMVPKEMKKPVFEMGRGCLKIKGDDYLKATYEFITCLHRHDPQRYTFMF